MPGDQSASPKKLRLGRMPAGIGPTFKAWLDSALRQIGRAVGVQVSIDGAESSSTGPDGSLRFKIAPSGTASHPFLCPAVTDGSTASVIPGGTVNGVSATGLSLTISATGTKYVYIDVTYTQGVTSNGYVIGFSGGTSTCALATGSSIPSDTSTHLYRQVAAYVSGVKYSQDILTSMEVAIRGYNASAAFNTYWLRS